MPEDAQGIRACELVLRGPVGHTAEVTDDGRKSLSELRSIKRRVESFGSVLLNEIQRVPKSPLHDPGLRIQIFVRPVVGRSVVCEEVQEQVTRALLVQKVLSLTGQQQLPVAFPGKAGLRCQQVDRVEGGDVHLLHRNPADPLTPLGRDALRPELLDEAARKVATLRELERLSFSQHLQVACGIDNESRAVEGLVLELRVQYHG